jgi:flagellar hook-associated protein 3
MRITDKIRYNATRGDLTRLQNRSVKLYKELSSGKRVNRPSDDPFSALQASSLTTHQRQLEQFARNLDTAKIQLYAADNALNQAVGVITEARTTTLSAVSVVGDKDSRRVMADTVSQLKEQMFNLANSRVGDTFIFGGFQSTQRPYTRDAVTGVVSYRGDSGAMQLEVGEGTLQQTTLMGSTVFGGGSSVASLSAGASYTGLPTVIGQYNGALGNVRVKLEAMTAGDPNNATFRVSFDNGATFDDNGGAGYTVEQLNEFDPAMGPLRNLGVQLRLSENTTSFSVGDSVDLLLTTGAGEDLFSLLDELERALREADDITKVGAVDYDGNGIADAQDLQDAMQAVIDTNTPSAANPIQNPLTGPELDFFVKQARDKRFEQLVDARFQSLIGRLDKALSQVSDHQSIVGLGLNKVESAESANLFLQEQVVTTKARYEDSDFTEAVSEMTLVETALQAATSTTSRVLQGISLLDYLR